MARSTMSKKQRTKPGQQPEPEWMNVWMDEWMNGWMDGFSPWWWLSATLFVVGFGFALATVYLGFSDYQSTKYAERSSSLNKLAADTDTYRAMEKSAEEEYINSVQPSHLLTQGEPTALDLISNNIENQDIVKEHREKMLRASERINEVKAEVKTRFYAPHNPPIPNPPNPNPNSNPNPNPNLKKAGVYQGKKNS